MGEFLLTLLIWLFHWGIILPTVMLIATPYLLIRTLLRRERLSVGLRAGYSSILRSFHEFWDRGGWGFGP